MEVFQEKAKFKESIEIKMRTYFSIQHIQSAAIFCRKSYELENQYDGTFNQDLITEHKAYVTNAIFSSACFLEATINEIFCDAADSPNEIKSLGERNISLLSDMWKLNIPRTASYPIIEKYQIALTLLGKPLFVKGETPCQNIDILIKLRNSLMHYEPEWVTGQSDSKLELTKLEKQLNGKFTVSKIFKNKGNPFFPDKCLGHGCAEWAVVNSIKFADEFFEKISLKPTFDHVRGNLNTI